MDRTTMDINLSADRLHSEKHTDPMLKKSAFVTTLFLGESEKLLSFHREHLGFVDSVSTILQHSIPSASINKHASSLARNNTAILGCGLNHHLIAPSHCYIYYDAVNRHEDLEYLYYSRHVGGDIRCTGRRVKRVEAGRWQIWQTIFVCLTAFHVLSDSSIDVEASQYQYRVIQLSSPAAHGRRQLEDPGCVLHQRA